MVWWQTVWTVRLMVWWQTVWYWGTITVRLMVWWKTVWTVRLMVWWKTVWHWRKTITVKVMVWWKTVWYWGTITIRLMVWWKTVWTVKVMVWWKTVWHWGTITVRHGMMRDRQAQTASNIVISPKTECYYLKDTHAQFSTTRWPPPPPSPPPPHTHPLTMSHLPKVWLRTAEKEEGRLCHVGRWWVTVWRTS